MVIFSLLCFPLVKLLLHVNWIKTLKIIFTNVIMLIYWIMFYSTLYMYNMANQYACLWKVTIMLSTVDGMLSIRNICQMTLHSYSRYMYIMCKKADFRIYNSIMLNMEGGRWTHDDRLDIVDSRWIYMYVCFLQASWQILAC